MKATSPPPASHSAGYWQRPPNRGRRLEVYDLVLKHPTTGRNLINSATFTIHEGDRMVLSGPSGSGKSTLACTLAGLRRPDGGVILLDGRDLQTWGEPAWRKQIVYVPQFHQNRLLTQSLLFNLLLGTLWPPSADLRNRALAVCEELGLGPVINRMPNGLDQICGETGWSLSQGEQARVHIARAILQQPAIVILDESFSGLDSQTQHLTYTCLDRHLPALVVITHT